MIIVNRAAAVRYNADPVAQNVRSFIDASARLAPAREISIGAPSNDDFARLYPSIFTTAEAPSVLIRSGRAAVLAVSAVAGTAAVFVAILLK